MTSACCEDFLALDLAMGSSDWVRFEEGRGLEDGEDGEEQRRETLTVARPWWCTDPDDYISIPCSLARTSLSEFALGSTSSSSTTSSSAFQIPGYRLTQAALLPSSTSSVAMPPTRYLHTTQNIPSPRSSALPSPGSTSQTVSGSLFSLPSSLAGSKTSLTTSGSEKTLS